jgi:hypothetical protein
VLKGLNSANQPSQFDSTMNKSKTDPKTRRKYNKSGTYSSKQPDRNGPWALNQIQYRSYQQEIQIYHFRTRYMSVGTFRSLLRRDSDLHGYVDILIGSERPLYDLYVPDGDDTPDGCIEVAYLSGVFPRRGTPGCALGFRSGDSVIEWLVFSQPVDTILSSWMGIKTHPNEVIIKVGAHRDDPCKLFDLVAFMPKGQAKRRVRGSNAEHKKWHDSLWNAKLRPVKLKMTWKNFGTGLRAQIELPQAEIEWGDAKKEKANADDDVDDHDDDNDNGDTGNVKDYNENDSDDDDDDDDDSSETGEDD